MSERFAGLRVCLVGPIPPPAGGMANQTAQLKRLLEQEGAEVNLVPVNAPYRPAVVGKVPVIRAAFRLLPYFFNLYRQYQRADVVHLMANSGWSWHLFAAPAIWMAYWLNKPLLVNYRGGHADSFFARSWKWVVPSLKRASGVLVPSAFLQEVFARWNWQADVVPNVLDEGRFHPAPDRAPGSQLPEVHLIVTRNLEAIYDVATVIRCFSQVRQAYPQAQLSIAGSGPQRKMLERLCDELSLRDSVTFLGRLEAKQMAELYRSADVMLNGSLVDNSPNSLIEAMACGVPVVSSNVGGIPKLATDGVDALLVPPGEPAMMAEQVVRVLDDESLRRRLITNGLTTIGKYTWPKVGDALLGHYQRAMAAQEVRA
ncbi:glycosyltransferase [Bowmanella dokdonensis]|uniref:Glycosyltransferase family 4 protein n=1 Tax=Bowmanella dokdonensis TaxID=751969 RepID=A0A939DQX5_9ALTE|nr:glycosyltransferase family 4 protein [Bowmanella dokdonensis]